MSKKETGTLSVYGKMHKKQTVGIYCSLSKMTHQSGVVEATCIGTRRALVLAGWGTICRNTEWHGTKQRKDLSNRQKLKQKPDSQQKVTKKKKIDYR